MKIFVLLALACVFSGCVHGWTSDVSAELPYSQLVNTEWKLKEDAYIVEFQDHRGFYYIFACEKLGSVTFPPDWDWRYNENNIGKINASEKVVGGLRAGEVLKVVRVLKNSHIEIGVTYHPIMITEQNNKWSGKKELDGGFLLDRFDSSKCVFDPKHVEPVSVQ